MKTFHLILLSLIMCTSVVAAQKIDTVTVIHDGITMALKRQGEGRVEIAYAEVPVQLRELGVQIGTVLVSGQWGPDQIMTGNANMFTKECGTISYPIRGMIELDNTLTIVGPTPTSCEDRSLHWNENAVLRFTPPPRQFAEPKPEQKPKLKPKPRVVERRQEAPRRQADQYQWNWREQWRW